MAAQDCIDAFEAAAGRKLRDGDEALFEAFERRKAYAMRMDSSLAEDAAAAKVAGEIGMELRMAAVIEKRNAAINLRVRAEKVQWVQNVFGNKPAEGLEAMLAGVNRAKSGARVGAAQIQHALSTSYLAGFGADIERTGLKAVFASGALDRDIARAMWAMGRDGEEAALRALPEQAVTVARVISKWQEVARLDANAVGAWIGKSAGYIVRQTHDAARIMSGGLDAWKAMAKRTFDLDSMMLRSGFDDVDHYLGALYTNLASGNHLKAVPDGEISGFKGPGNVAKKLSQSREILFKDADAWYDYNAEFGARNLREGVMGGLMSNASATGLMKQFGPNPEAMLDTIRNDIIQQAKDAGEVQKVLDIQGAKGKLDNIMAAVDGSMNAPGNALWARRFANIRSWEMLTKLGGMLLSQLNDIAVYGAGTRYQGRGFLSGMAEAVSGLGRDMKAPEVRELAASLGVALENMAGELGRVGSFSEPGAMSRMTELFMKFNGSTWWVDRFRASAAIGMSSHMAMQAEKSWAQIGSEYQRLFTLYGIDEKDWNVIRQAAQKQVDGRSYITPELMQQLPDATVSARARELGKLPDDGAAFRQKRTAAIAEQTQALAAREAALPTFEATMRASGNNEDAIKAAIASEKGSIGQLQRKVKDLADTAEKDALAHEAKLPEAQAGALAGVRKDLQEKLRTYFTDQTGYLALEPDAKTRALMLQGTQPGTWTGEMMRFMTQFKSFTGAYMQKIMGRELYGRGYEGDSIIGALRAGNGEFQGIASLIAMSSLMGYGSLALKDMIRGKQPPPPTDPKTFLAAMVQGGGAGIYGDFLFGAASRTGNSTLENLAGPVPSSAAQIVELYHKALQGDDVAAHAMLAAINNTPFNNLYYLRPVLNYAVIYRAQEMMNPGYLRRLERQADKDGSPFLIRPTVVQ